MKLSIITVNLNNLHGLQKTMKIILSQTSHDYEWIVIDGGSTDGSKELIEQNVEHIAYWVSELDNGIYAAMNKGIEVATGDYLLFLNSGDCLYNNDTINRFVNFNSDSDVIYGDAKVVDNEGKECHDWKTPTTLRLSFFLKGGLNHQATFIKRDCFNKRRYELNSIYADTVFFVSLLISDYRFTKIEEFIAKYDNTGISSTSFNRQEYKDTVLRKLPYGIQEDYKDIALIQDIDLGIMTKEIVRAPKMLRNIARLFIYPLYYVAKFISCHKGI